MLSPTAVPGPQRGRSFAFNVSPLDEQLFDAVQKHNAVEVEHLIQKKCASVIAQGMGFNPSNSSQHSLFDVNLLT